MRINIKNAAPKEKPRLVIGKKAEPASQFQALVKQAIDAWHRLEKLKAPGGSKLSRDAFLRETLKCSPGATVSGVQKLRRKLESGDPSLTNTRSALRVMVKELKGPFVKTPPKPENWGRIERWFLRPRVTEVIGELTAVDSNTVELFGVAILQAGDVFGTADGEQRDVDAEIAAQEKELADLFKQIERTWTADDVDAGRYVNGRSSPAKFKGTDVEIAGDNPGKRLIEYLLSKKQS
jgi:hypothetical protein